MKLRALDLFCCAGGATRGLQMAGFHVTGVDIKPQPRYCGDAFFQTDALTFPLEGFDFIWASPPCQAFTIAGANMRRDGTQYPDLVARMRSRLAAQRTSWVMENVPGAPLRVDLVLCGSHFGLRLARHRLFEFDTPKFNLMPSCSHAPDLITVCGHGTPSWMRQSRIRKGLHPNLSVALKREVMGCPWMDRAELSQAIPPAYSQFIAEAFLRTREEAA